MTALISMTDILTILSPGLAAGYTLGESLLADSLNGHKLVFNEFGAFVEFIGQMETVSEHSQAAVSFVLCGCANFAPIGIQPGDSAP